MSDAGDHSERPLQLPRLPATTTTSDVEGYKTRFESVGPDELIERVSADHPHIAALLNADDAVVESLIAAMSRPDRRSAFTALATVGFSLEKRSRYSESLRVARMREMIARSDPPDCIDSFHFHTQPRNIGDTLHDVGRLQNEMGDHTLALSSLLQAEASFAADAALRAAAGINVRSEFDLAFHLEDFRSQNFAAIADVYRLVGNEVSYSEYTKKAWEFSQLGADPNGRYESLMSSARGARERGDREQALGDYVAALDLALTLKSSQIVSREVAEAVSGAAEIYVELGLYRRALEMFGQSRDLNERAGHGGRLLADYMRIARVHTDRGDVQAALDAYTHALRQASVPAVRPDADPLVWADNGQQRLLSRLDASWRILLEMGRLERKRNATAALTLLRRAVDVVELVRGRIAADVLRIGYQGRTSEVYDELIDTLADAYQQSRSRDLLKEIFESIERAKARVLAELLADQPIPAPAGVPTDLIDRELALMSEVERLQRTLESEAEPSSDQLERLAAATGALAETWNAIAAADPEAGPSYVSLRRADPTSCDAVQAMLHDSGTARVAFANFYVTASRVISATVFSDRTELHYAEHRIERTEMRSLVRVSEDEPPPEVCLPYWELDFSAMTIGRFAEAVTGYDIVCLSPHDVLHSLPLHAFRPAADRPPFIQSTTISYAPSAAVLGFCLRKRTRSQGPNLVVGGPERPDLPPIAHSVHEGVTVAQILECEPLIGPAATRAAAAARTKNARYLHFACHCEFRREAPMESAMMLADGGVTAREILGWRLASELVTVSACQSGVSRIAGGDELLGMVRALLFAGSPAVLVSLWNAYDETAASVMKEFYVQHVREHAPKAIALASAQSKVLLTGVPAFKWASYVLIGDWR